MVNIEPFVSSRVRELSDRKVQRASGALLLSDISGFTKMSEALGKKGKEGTEELSYLLNSYFRGMLKIIQRHDAEAIRFCGDSLLIAFYGNQSVRCPEACAHEMMREAEKFRNVSTCAGSFDVSMKIVGKTGQWNEFVLGDDRRREHFLCGAIIRKIVSMENRAESGDIRIERGKEGEQCTISNEQLSTGKSKSSGGKEGEQCTISNEQRAMNKQKADQDIRVSVGGRSEYQDIRYRSQTTNHELRTMNSKEEKGRAEERLKSFLPQGVAALVHGESPGEHRAVSTLFLNFYGYDEENPEVESVQELFGEVVSVTEKYGGVVHDIDSDSRGSNIMILFGAPISHENDAERVVMASMELSKLTIEPLKVRVGICTGFVYAGIVGSDWRKEYAVMGDAVNTAARLMETAKNGQTVISGATCSLTLDRIEYRKLKSSKVKGKEQLLKRFAPLGIKEEKHFRFGFVGREEELKGIVSAIAEGGKAIILKGGAGIGKSRLLHETRKRIEPTHKVLFGYTDELKGSLHFLTSMIAREAGIHLEEPENVRKVKLEKHIREIERRKSRKLKAEKGMKGGGGEGEKGRKNDELYKRLSFLGAMLFDIPYPNSLYESVSMSLRFENLCDAIRYYIEYQSTVDSPQSTVDSPRARDGTTDLSPMTNHLLPVRQNSRVVVMLDDFQWLRKDAVKIVEYVTRTLLTLSTEKDRITFVFSGRPEPDALAKLPLTEEIEVREFDLLPLPEESTAVLSSKILKNKRLPEDVAEIVFRRTRGNPFYLEQFLLDLMEKGLIREAEEKWVKTIRFKEEDVPENVFSTIISRVDRLEERAKEALRIGSVMGMEFDERIVGDVLKEPNVSRYFAQTEKESLTYRKAVGEIEHIFRHAMIKDVVYDSILRKQRREFHKLVGLGIEDLYEKEIERFYHLLAHHFCEAGEWDKALHYNLKAGRQAAKDYHNEEAIRYFSRAAEIGEEQQLVETDVNACLYEAYKQLGDIYTAISSCSISRGYYQNAIAVSGVADKERLVNALNGIAITHAKQGNYDEALKIGEEAYTISREIGYKHGTSRSLRSMGSVRWLQGMSKEALKCNTEALKISRKIGDEKGVGKCLDYMGILCGQQGKYQKALGYFTEALGIRKKIGDRNGIAGSLNNVGAILDRQGQSGQGLKYYGQSLRIFREIGDKKAAGLGLHNIGASHSNRGEYTEALTCCAQALSIGKEIGDRNGIVMALTSVAYVHLELGLFDHVIDGAKKAVSVLEETGARGELLNSLARLLASACVESGDIKEARAWIRKAKAIARKAKATESAAPLKMLMSRIYCKEGTSAALSKAKKQAEEALKISRKAKHASNEAGACLQLCEIWSAKEKKRSIASLAGHGVNGVSLRSHKTGTRDKMQQTKRNGNKLEKYATKALTTDRKMEAYAARALAIAKKSKSLPLLWQSYYHLYKTTGDERHLKKAKKHLAKQFQHVPARYLKDFKQYVVSETGISLP